MMTAEMNGTPYEKSILLIHAQDHFMTALAVRDMASLMVDMFEALQKAKKEG
jgi:PTS system cellobiose-specific IIA component